MIAGHRVVEAEREHRLIERQAERPDHRGDATGGDPAQHLELGLAEMTVHHAERRGGVGVVTRADERHRPRVPAHRDRLARGKPRERQRAQPLGERHRPDRPGEMTDEAGGDDYAAGARERGQCRMPPDPGGGRSCCWTPPGAICIGPVSGPPDVTSGPAPGGPPP